MPKRALFILSLAVFSTMVGNSMVVPFLPLYVRQLLILNVLVGTAYGVAFPSHVALAMENARGYGMGTVMSFLMLAHGVGMMIGPILFGVLASHFSLGSAFWGGGILSALLTAACYPLARAVPLQTQVISAAERAVAVAD